MTLQPLVGQKGHMPGISPDDMTFCIQQYLGWQHFYFENGRQFAAMNKSEQCR